MSFSYQYLTRRVIVQNYRDIAAVGIIGIYSAKQAFLAMGRRRDQNVTQHLYINDETDTMFKETTNKTDGAVKREKALAYCDKIKLLRAQREQASALDAYNYLHGKNHTLE